MAIDGNFLAEKEHVRSDMEQQLNSLTEDRVLAQKEKERVIITAVCSVFSYSTGFVDWTKAELDRISKMWIRAYKQAWTISSSRLSRSLRIVLVCQARIHRLCGIPSGSNIFRVVAKRSTNFNFSSVSVAERNQFSNYSS
jgi:hypothetical protein